MYGIWAKFSTFSGLYFSVVEPWLFCMVRGQVLTFEKLRFGFRIWFRLQSMVPVPLVKKLWFLRFRFHNASLFWRIWINIIEFAIDSGNMVSYLLCGFNWSCVVAYQNLWNRKLKKTVPGYNILRIKNRIHNTVTVIIYLRGTGIGTGINYSSS